MKIQVITPIFAAFLIVSPAFAGDWATEATAANILKLLTQAKQTDLDPVKANTDALVKLSTAQAEILFELDSLKALHDRGELLLQGSNGQTNSVPLNGYQANAQGQPVGGGAGYVQNLISPGSGMPIAAQRIPPTTLRPVSGSLLSGMQTVGQNYLASASSQEISAMAGVVGSFVGGKTGSVIASAGQAMAGLGSGGSTAIPVANGVYLRPAVGAGGGVDGMFQQLLGGGNMGQVSNAANALSFLASENYSTGGSSYSPLVGMVSNSAFGVNANGDAGPNGYLNLNSLLSNGASGVSPQAAAMYASYATKVLPQLLGSLGSLQQSGGKLIATDSAVTGAETSPAALPPLNPAKFALFAATSSSGSFLFPISRPRSSYPPHRSGFMPAAYVLDGAGGRVVFVVDSTSPTTSTSQPTAILAAGPSSASANGMNASLDASDARLSAIDKERAAVVAQQQVVTNLLKSSAKALQAVDAIAAKETAASGVGVTAQLEKALQDSIESEKNQLYELAGEVERLDQRTYNELCRRDADYADHVRKIQAEEGRSVDAVVRQAGGAAAAAANPFPTPPAPPAAPSTPQNTNTPTGPDYPTNKT